MNNIFYPSTNVNELKVSQADTTRFNFSNLLAYLDSINIESREYSICKTHLETACMYAIKAIYAKEDN